MPHKIVQFSRYGMWLGHTLAYKRFRDHHTEINNHYWALAPLASYGDYLARRSAPGLQTDVLFHASGPDARRLAPTTGEWRDQFREFENWVRLSAIMSATSYFEIYLRELLMLAVRSDPLCRFQSSQTLDGVSWLKRGVGGIPEREIRDCLIGEWPKRRKAMKSLLGAAPRAISNNIADLDRIRKLRNTVGHAFGRTMEQKSDPLSVVVAPSERISEKRLKGWLGLLDAIAKETDEEIGSAHVGEFETIMLYHDWRRQGRSGMHALKSEDSRFARALRARHGGGPGRAFCRDLIDHYQRC